MSGFSNIGNSPGSGGGAIGEIGVGSVGPFGTLLTSNMTPSGQATFAYGINTTQWVTASNGSGATVSLTDEVVECASGTSTSGSAEIRLSRGLKYRAGQGAICRLTAIFSSGVAGSYQLAGIGNNECGYYFAMSGSSFGILHRERSRLEIRSFTITTGVATSTNVTITLGGSSITTSIPGGGNIYQTAHELSKVDYSQVGGGWRAQSLGATVIFRKILPGPTTGTYSLSGGTIAYTTSTVQAGVAPTDTFISQSSWNINTLSGVGETDMILDTTKGNIYSIGYQYLGFGDPVFAIEDPATGAFVNCHRIQTANKKTSTVLKNPHTFAKWQAYNSGSSTSVSVKGASAGTFTEGIVSRNIGPSFSVSFSKSSLSDLTSYPVLTIRADRAYQSKACYGELDVFNLSVGTDTGNASDIRLLLVTVLKNATLTGPVNYLQTDTQSFCSYDVSATGFSGGQQVKSFIVAANSSQVLSLAGENFFLANGETLTIVAKPLTGAISTAAGSVSWFEDQ